MALGSLVKNMEYLILDENGNEVGLNEKEEGFCISGKQATSGYLKNPEKKSIQFLFKEG
ncbi:MAG: hypothetical protein R2764_14305 [Bacteroidales bacterium]